jgi:uncharacterized membrane protein
MRLKPIARNIIKDAGVYLILCAATYLMLKIITEYYGFNEHVGFLRFKQEYLHIRVWKTAFYIHVFSSIFTLLAGFTQFSGHILKNYKKLHRIMGRIYVADILFINFPAGMIMAWYANGELPSKIAFVILDCLWFTFTLKAFLEARRRNIAVHKQFMIRSYALTFSAITLRTWKLILSNTFVIDPVTLYMIDAWIGFVPNLLLAEWIIRRKKKERRHAIISRS